jgi:hypothetical protein
MDTYRHTAGHSSRLCPFADMSLPPIAFWQCHSLLVAVLMLIPCWSSDACVSVECCVQEEKQQAHMVNHGWSPIGTSGKRQQKQIKTGVTHHRSCMYALVSALPRTLLGKMLQHSPIQLRASLISTLINSIVQELRVRGTVPLAQHTWTISDEVLQSIQTID